MSKKVVWSESYKISSYLVNLRGRAGLYAILNLIQDVGWMHAFHLEINLPKNMGWVFTRQKLIITEWPAWNQTVELRTWLRPPSPEGFLYRDYEIYLQEKKIGECTSTFTIMDRTTRKMAPQDWNQFPQIWHKNSPVEHLPAKVIAPTDMTDLMKFEVRNSDIDFNQHVNNTKYAQWILDALPIDILREGAELHEYEVNFLSESRPRDVISLLSAEPEKKTPAQIIFKGLRQSDQKTVFTAQIRFTRS